jgi:FkbM family methyltransferase
MDWLKDDGIFMPMINDTGRNNFYKSCIDSVAQGRVICDIGAGTGFLTVLAVQAGAKKVIAVEKDFDRYNFVKSNIEKLNLQDKVEVVHADFLSTDISADYYVTETFGSAIFDENIISIADHTQKMSGCLIPGQVEVHVKVYRPHPIFAVVQRESDAHEFQPDIDINNDFYNLINTEFKKANPIQKTRFRSNWINNLFTMYKQMDDLKLSVLYESESLVVDFSKPAPKLEFNLPPNIPAGQFCIFWKAKFQNIEMDVTDTWWPTPTRFVHDTSKGVKIYYDNINSWWFEWH